MLSYNNVVPALRKGVKEKKRININVINTFEHISFIENNSNTDGNYFSLPNSFIEYYALAITGGLSDKDLHYRGDLNVISINMKFNDSYSKNYNKSMNITLNQKLEAKGNVLVFKVTSNANFVENETYLPYGDPIYENNPTGTLYKREFPYEFDTLFKNKSDDL